MARGSTVSVLLSAQEMRLVRARVRRGGYRSESDVVREGLQLLLTGPKESRRRRAEAKRALAAGYRATARQDRRIVEDWAQMADPWPQE